MAEHHVTPRQRSQIARRAGNRCEYCLSPVSFAIHTFHIEHIVPLALGGQTTLSNLAYSCGGCNSFKHTRVTGRDPISNEMVPLYNPRQDRWHDHFAWGNDFLQIVGLTATGRATISTLYLNRSGLVNLRRALFAISEHPPTMDQ